MADVKFVHSSAGYIELMKSGAMSGVLHSYSDAIESAANGAMAPDRYGELYNPAYVSHDFQTSERAGVRIQTANPHAVAAERVHGHLQNAAGV